MPRLDEQHQVASIKVCITIIQGRNLVAKDRNLIGRKTTSDPYITYHYDCKTHPHPQQQGRTKTIKKTLSPIWNHDYHFFIFDKVANAILQKKREPGTLEFFIYDEDALTFDDPMGTVAIPLPIFGEETSTTKWYPVAHGSGRNYCKDATGEIQIKIDLVTRKFLSLQRGNSQPIPGGIIQIGLGWDVENGRKIDLDASCVAIDHHGDIRIDETVYYGDLTNSNGSIRHSGDERTGDLDLDGDDEVITIDLDRVPQRVLALYVILTVATPGKTFADVSSALVRIGIVHGASLGHHVPRFAGEDRSTAMFLMRLARNVTGGFWVKSIIEDSAAARDFGSLIPEIKGYSRDLVPNIKIDLNERIAVMRKGGNIRLRDYSPVRNSLPEVVTMGLAWDVTHGKNIDLDASAICMNAKFERGEIVYYNHLISNNGSIRHSGDEREGDEVGDDEKISVALGKVPDDVAYIVFVVNSFSGQELDDVSKASCHLFDPHTKTDIATYKISNSSALDKHTGLVMACLYRDESHSWSLYIISEPGHGKVAIDLCPKVQYIMENHPPKPPTIPPEPEIVVNEMPDFVPIVDEEIDLSGS